MNMFLILILKFLGVFVNTGIIGPKSVSVCLKTSAHFFLIDQTRLDHNKTQIINIKYFLIYRFNYCSFYFFNNSHPNQSKYWFVYWFALKIRWYCNKIQLFSVCVFYFMFAIVSNQCSLFEILMKYWSYWLFYLFIFFIINKVFKFFINFILSIETEVKFKLISNCY
jgi:hypothetical protein